MKIVFDLTNHLKIGFKDGNYYYVNTKESRKKLIRNSETIAFIESSNTEGYLNITKFFAMLINQVEVF